MIRLAILFIAAFVLATAGTSVLLAPKHGAPDTPADSSVTPVTAPVTVPAAAPAAALPDSAAHDTNTPPTSTNDTGAVPIESSARRAADTASTAPVRVAPAPGRSAKIAEPTASAGPPSVPSEPGTGPKPATLLVGSRLAKMFGAMEPKHAAKVLSQMADEDVRTILGTLPERRAGEILALLTPERAAAVSRGLMRPSAK